MQVNEKRTDNKSKKSKTIIVAAIVLMLCLITTCVVGTTLAKYTTQGSGNDSAQVAKWGVKIEIQGASDMFKEEYLNGSAATVKSTVSNVVAPGTSGSMTFSIKGTPEVALKLDVVFTSNNDVFLKAGNYTGYSNITEDYHPVKFTLKKGETVVDGADSVSLETVKEIINDLSEENHAVSATPMDATYTLSWKWAFDGVNDKADTLLGDLIAATDPTAVVTGITSDKYSTTIDFNLTITATQID